MSNTIAINHMRLLSTWNIANLTEEPNIFTEIKVYFSFKIQETLTQELNFIILFNFNYFKFK